MLDLRSLLGILWLNVDVGVGTLFFGPCFFHCFFFFFFSQQCCKFCELFTFSSLVECYSIRTSLLHVVNVL